MTKLSGFSTLYCTLYGCHFGSYEPHIFFIPGAWPLHGSVGYMNRVIKIPVCYLLLLLEESSLQDFPSSQQQMIIWDNHYFQPLSLAHCHRGLGPILFIVHWVIYGSSHLWVAPHRKRVIPWHPSSNHLPKISTLSVSPYQEKMAW